MKLRRRTRDQMFELVVGTGKNRKVTGLGTRDEAEAEHRARKVLAGGNPREGYSLKQALEREWERRWQHQKGSKNQRYVVDKVIRDLGKLDVEDVSYQVLEDYTESLEAAGLKAATINHRMTTISVALSGAAKRGKLRSLPVIPRPTIRNQKDRYVTETEEASLMSACRKLSADDDQFIMSRLIGVLLDTGARLSEITGSAPDDIRDQCLVILDAKTASGQRVVPLTARAMSSLRQLHDHEKWQAITRNVRTSKTRKASAKDWLVKKFTLVRDTAALPDVTLHILRHTCASRLIQNGADRYAVMQWLGHSSFETTKRYAHLAPTQLRGLADILDRPSATVVPLVVNTDDRC